LGSRSVDVDVDEADEIGNATPSSMLIREGIPLGRAPEIELRNQHMTCYYRVRAA